MRTDGLIDGPEANSRFRNFVNALKNPHSHVHSSIMTFTHSTRVDRVSDFTINVSQGKFVSSLERGFGTRFTN